MCSKKSKQIWVTRRKSRNELRGVIVSMERKAIIDEALEKMWDELEDVPVDENECIDIDWHGWSKGTHREEIWHWFDERHSKGVGWLMIERETKY